MVSVVIPTHKRAGLLIYGLERIYGQKGVEMEVAVINDIEDEDETDRIAELFPGISYVKSGAIQGPSEKHKKGLSMTGGEYVYMPDDDDYLIDDRFFEKAVKILEENPDVAFVSGNVNILVEGENGETVGIRPHRLAVSGKINGLEYLQEFQRAYPKPLSTVSTLFRRSSLDPDMIEMSDSSMYMNALLCGNAFIMDDTVAVYRIRKKKGGSLTSSASLPFIMNALRQKESLYLQARTRIPRPGDFWRYQFANTYSLLAEKPGCKQEKSYVVKWGFRHLHGSFRLLLYLCRLAVTDGGSGRPGASRPDA